MQYQHLRARIPGFLREHILHFEVSIERAAADFAASLNAGARVLDAGAGEAQYAGLFARHRYVAIDLGIGDASWNYRKLDCIADLAALPLRTGSCDACVNIVTLEHVRDPARVLMELARALKPGGRILLIVPHEWEVHQQPHDYYRYTRHGVRYLLESAGFGAIRIEPVGGFFRLLSRRLWNGLQFFPGASIVVGAILFAPLALVLPWFDGLDRQRNFTLGYICTAQKPS
jgi:SAM-dependent methyltransferase